MAISKHIDKICIFAVVFALLISILFMNGAAFGIQAQVKTMGYEDRLFDTTKVHTIDIVIDDWEGFLQTAESEEYSVCNVVIDGETFKNVGIRGKGNTSLSTVASMDSVRYSFKVEFDQYDTTKSYYGLDKLSLNNLIQDNTMMKDYLTYQMMNEFCVAAPLSSYAYITVNGEDWGLYLAVEAVEESFLQRNYGSDYGDLYKPDSMNMGGGRGNGADFDFEDFTASFEDEDSSGGTTPSAQQGFDPSQMGGMLPGGDGQQVGMNSGNKGGFGMFIDEDALRKAFTELEIDTALLDGIDFDKITMDNVQSVISALDQETMQKLMEKLVSDSSFGDMGNFGGMGMGSGETSLQYSDDNPNSYSTIFSSAKTNVTNADQARLIAALKALSEYQDSAVDVESVIRYFVVHNYVVNGDSYTGSMVHNYYLYEEDGKLSMIPWDYNLAFGTFQGGSASVAVNDDIDAPLSVTGNDRPMIDWIFRSEVYTAMYHRYFQDFLSAVDVQSIITNAKELIAPYVEKDPTKFCSFEEFETAVETLAAFCDLRSKSVAQQLAGEDASVDASALNLSAMGTMDGGFGGGDRQPDSTDGSNTQKPNFSGDTGSMPQSPGQSGTGNGISDAGGGSQQFPGFEGQGGMTPPDEMENMFPSQNSNDQGSSVPEGQHAAGLAQGSNRWIVLGATFVILAAGILFAFKFKR